MEPLDDREIAELASYHHGIIVPLEGMPGQTRQLCIGCGQQKPCTTDRLIDMCKKLRTSARRYEESLYDNDNKLRLHGGSRIC